MRRKPLSISVLERLAVRGGTAFRDAGQATAASGHSQLLTPGAGGAIGDIFVPSWAEYAWGFKHPSFANPGNNTRFGACVFFQESLPAVGGAGALSGGRRPRLFVLSEQECSPMASDQCE
jgi:hypothetical protein